MNSTREAALVKKVTWRLMPFLFLLYVVAFLDRANVGFAKLKFMTDLKYDESVFLTGAGIFFIGYFIFEVPSNVILEKIGAKIWITRIMITWGIIASCMMFITKNHVTYYCLRFLLGAAEAGFYPGILLYLTYWFTPKERAGIISIFMTAAVCSNILGSPLSGYLLQYQFFGLNSWQTMFLLEGIPAILLGFCVLGYLPDGPMKAKWLVTDEQEHLVNRLKPFLQAGVANHKKWYAVFQPALMPFFFIYFFLNMSSYTVTFFLPTIVQTVFHVEKGNTFKTGLITAIPYTFAIVTMLLVGRSSDRTGERKLHVAYSAFVSAIGFVIAALAGTNGYTTLFGLTIAAIGIWSLIGPFWAMPTTVLQGTAAAGGIAAINSFGNLGGFLGPFIKGQFEITHQPTSYIYWLFVGTMILAGILAYNIRLPKVTLTQPNHLD